MTQSTCTHMTTRTLTQRLADRIGSHKYDMWFDRTAKLTVSAERVEVATGSQFVADWIASHFSDDLRGVASEALGRPSDVHLHVDPDMFDPDAARRGLQVRPPRPGAQQPSLDLPLGVPAVLGKVHGGTKLRRFADQRPKAPRAQTRAALLPPVPPCAR